MATYKLIQDIEAEDHILGPLTLRQFILAIIACFFGWINFLCITKGIAWLTVVFGPMMLFFVFFAAPWGRDQPTEIWALAKLRYWFKPRRRIWNQSGIKEMVTITVPKKVEHFYTDGLTQPEVQSRLQALASTIDSRGWAVKNVSSGTYTPQPAIDMESDRLIDIQSMPGEVPAEQLPAADDILDETSNPIAQQFDAMITRSSQAHRRQLIDQLNSGGQAASSSTDSNVTIATAAAVPAAAASATEPVAKLGGTGADPDNSAILSLANNNDLNVATLAREAHKAGPKDIADDALQNEVVISLH